MKNILIALALLQTVACAKKTGTDLTLSGSANKFEQTEKKAFAGAEAIENSFVLVSGKLKAFFDPSATGAMLRRDMETGETKTVLPTNARFSYVMSHQGELLNFVTINGQIHRSRSIDGGDTWFDHRIVVMPTIVQWNPGVAVDGSGNWHMLIEASETGVGPRQGDVACYYYTSSDGLNWTNHGRAIEHCGNAYLTVTSKGVLAIHGDLKTGVWSTTASTLTGTTWTTHREKFFIGADGVHVCDPHAIEVNGKILLSVSVDQNSINLTEALDSFEALHERLLQ